MSNTKTSIYQQNSLSSQLRLVLNVIKKVRSLLFAKKIPEVKPFNCSKL